MENQKFDEYLKNTSSQTQQLEQHHIIPVSLGGLDTATNLRDILTSPHKLIHQILNVSEWSMRTLKKALAKSIANNDIIWALKAYQHTQNFYFQNIDNLPQELKALHYESFLEQIKELESMIKDLEDFLIKKWLDKEEIPQIEMSENEKDIFFQKHDYMWNLRILRQYLLEEKTKILNYKLKGFQVGLFR